jgi:preprotein translocase subunit SecA
MNTPDQSTTPGTDIEELKQQLALFCTEKKISKFEAEDIVELLEEGESVEWVMEQLKSDAPDLDEASTGKLLSDIRFILGPKEEPEEMADSSAEESAEETGTESLDISKIDLSQLDLSQLKSMLPEGMQLPPGMGIEQLQKMMESTQGKIMADLTAFCQEQGVDLSAMTDPEQMQELEAQWKETPRPAFDGKTPAEMLEGEPSLIPKKVETFRREEPRVGRNDPCPCGSGKKYKKCCGRGK